MQTDTPIWLVESRNNVSGNLYVRAGTVAEDAPIIATIHQGDDGALATAQRACLMAAAPELRDALTMLVNLHGRRGNDRVVVDGIVRDARALLARLG